MFDARLPEMRFMTLTVVAALAITGSLRAANCYWSNAGGDSRWSNPANWTTGAPASNDTVRLADNCPDEPQNIILDADAWLADIVCTATGNRHYTITPVNDEFIRLNDSYAIGGNSSRTVALTINADIRVGSGYLRVQSFGSHTTLNGRIYPSPGEIESIYLIAHFDNPVVLGGSNTLTSVSCQDRANIVVNHPFALGQGYVKCVSGSERTLLTVQTNAVVNGYLEPDGPFEIRIAETGEQPVTLDVRDQTLSGSITVMPRGNNANGQFFIRFPVATGPLLGKLWLEEYSTLVFTNESGTTYWGGSNYAAEYGAVSGPGKVIVNGAGAVTIAATNCYEGGTYIRRGTLTMYKASCLPTNGTVWLSAGATLSGYTGSRQHQFAGLSGAGSVAYATFTLTRSLEPGENGAGTLSFTGGAKLILGPNATTTFELDTPDGNNDLINLLHSNSNLTLDGTLRVVNLGGLARGSYKLFDMAGAGRVFGAFKRIEMPPASAGTVEVNASGDVILHVTRQFGTVFTVR